MMTVLVCMTQIYHPGNQREDVPVYWLLDLTPHIRHEGVTKSPLGTTMLTALSLSSPLSSLGDFNSGNNGAPDDNCDGVRMSVYARVGCIHCVSLRLPYAT